MHSLTTHEPSLHAGKYLTVAIENEIYGISVLKVREIIRLPKITPVPQVPDFVKGVINLRGRVIPVVDLRLRFGMKAEITDRTCIVVAQVTLVDRCVQMGVIVDRVEEVTNLTREQIEPTPDFGVRVDTAHLLGVAKSSGRVLMLLELDRVLSSTDVQALTARPG
jgi:purine-binding chemotaxis protein CheW